MKKNFKYMLVALLTVFGFSAAIHAIDTYPLPAEIEDGPYKYEITKMPTTSNPVGTVKLLGLTDAAKAEANYSDLHITNGELSFPEQATYTAGGKNYTFNVTEMASDAFKNVCFNAKSVTIPKYLEEIPTAAFNTLTRLTTLTFAEGSQLKTIGNQAFASTNISNFDFTPCTKLAELPDEVFVEAWSGEGDINLNVNSVITTIALPTGSNFKHINGALRNLTSLTTINLKDTWVREIVDGAFANCAFTELELPGIDLLYISGNAFAGCEKLATLTINADRLIEIGGGKVEINPAYYDVETGLPVLPLSEKYVWTPSYYATNLYGLDQEDKEAGDVAPLVTLNLKNTSADETFEGKVNTNAFAWCDNMDGLDLTELNFGTESQIKTHAFYYCEGIEELTIGDIKDNQLGNNQYTIDANAFELCPIATLTLGNIETANAIGSAAFGNKLETVTIGNVEAGDAAFAGAVEANAEADPPVAAAPGAFVFANESGTTLNLAWNSQKLGYLSSESPATKTIIPAGAFDFSAVTGLDEDGKAISGFVLPVLNIGELKSQGGIFAEGAFIGELIAEVNFKGNINTNGLNTHFIATATEHVDAADAVYEMAMQDKVYDGSDEAHTVPAGTTVGNEVTTAQAGDFVSVEDKVKKVVTPYVAGVEFTYEQYNGQDVVFSKAQIEIAGGSYGSGVGQYREVDDDQYKRVVSGKETVEATFEQEESEEKKVYTADELDEMGVEDGDPAYPAADGADGYNHILKQAVEEGDVPVNALMAVTFEGAIKTKGITNKTNSDREPDAAKGPFSNFPNLVTVTFNGELSENAVDANTFINSINASATGQMISYNVNPVRDSSVNPFNSNAFADATTGRGFDRVLNWTVADPTLADLINHAILQNEEIDEEDAEVVDIMFNVFKWEPKKVKEDEDGGFFVIYQDYKTSATHQNPDPTMAWGRYDLGSFKEEKGKDYDDTAWEPLYDEESGDPVPVIDPETDLPVMINLTGYQPTDMLIDRVQTIKQSDDSELTYKLTLYGVYTDEDDIEEKSTVYMVPLEVFNGQYAIPETNTHLIIAKATATKGTIVDPDVKVYYTTDIDGKNSVWSQLQDATNESEADNDSYRVFKKANDTWTNEELADAITRYVSNEDAPAVDGADIWIMTDPSKYRGFRVDKNEFVASTPTADGAFIAEGWYFALLATYTQGASARVVWLDEVEATAIFGVQEDKVSVNSVKNGFIYNMLGQKVNKSYRGVIIKDGKKFFNK